MSSDATDVTTKVLGILAHTYANETAAAWQQVNLVHNVGTVMISTHEHF